MRISKDNNKVVDLNKVQWADLLWVCHSFGVSHRRKTKPLEPTINGNVFECKAPAQKVIIFPDETMLERAKRRGLLDEWYPQLVLQLTANHSLVYTGQKALDLWKAWQAKIFSKKDKKK